MADLNRNSVLAGLEALGSEDDAAVLAAARALHAQVTAAGARWEDLLQPENPPEVYTEEPEDEEPEDEELEDEELEDEEPDDVDEPEDEDIDEPEEIALQDNEPDDDDGVEDEEENDDDVEGEEENDDDVEGEEEEEEEEEEQEEEGKEKTEASAAPPPASPTESGDDLAIIDALLARPKLFEGTRIELEGYKEDIEAGEAGDFTPADSKYLRALAARLNKPAPRRNKKPPARRK